MGLDCGDELELGGTHSLLLAVRTWWFGWGGGWVEIEAVGMSYCGLCMGGWVGWVGYLA